MADNFDNFEEIIDEDDKNLLNSTEIIETEQEEDNYDEVLQLTEYTSGEIINNNPNIAAEYDAIDLIKTEKRNETLAKSFVQKVTKFIKDFKDLELSDEHDKYLTQVGQLQLENLRDLLTLVDINKGMIKNIVRRIDSVQAEDYAMIQTYNSVVNQHLKLLKELQATYKNVPQVIKRMRTEILCNQELGDVEKPDENVITENYGKTQFNNQKDMLKRLKEEQELKLGNKDNNK